MTSFNLSSISFDPSKSQFLGQYAEPLVSFFRKKNPGQDGLIAKASLQAPEAPILPLPVTDGASSVVAQTEPGSGKTPPIGQESSQQPGSVDSNVNPGSDFGIPDGLWKSSTPEQQQKYRDSIIGALIQQNISDKSNDKSNEVIGGIYDKLVKNAREIANENNANQMAAFYAKRGHEANMAMIKTMGSGPGYPPQTITFNPQITPGVIYRLGPTFNPQQQQMG